MTSRPALSLALLAALLAAPAGCGAEPPKPAAPATVSAGAPTDAGLAARPSSALPKVGVLAAPTSASTSETLPMSKSPAYVIGTGKGRNAHQLGRMFAPTQERARTCMPNTSGSIKVRVESKPGKGGKPETVFTVDPDVALDVETRRCFLEALSTIELDDESTKQLGPQGFTSHIMISW